MTSALILFTSIAFIYGLHRLYWAGFDRGFEEGYSKSLTDQSLRQQKADQRRNR